MSHSRHDFPGHTMRAVTPGGTAVIFQAMMTRLGFDLNSLRKPATHLRLVWET